MSVDGLLLLIQKLNAINSDSQVPLTHHVALVLQQRHQYVGSERHWAAIQSFLHLRVHQAAHLAELSLRPLVFQEPSRGPGQDAPVDLHVGLSLEEAPEHEGRQPGTTGRTKTIRGREIKAFTTDYMQKCFQHVHHYPLHW